MATSPTDVALLRGGGRDPPLGGPGALQHRRRRLRQASARQARRWSTSTTTGPCARSRWGELQDLANQAAHVLRDGGRRARATASRSCCRRRPETAAVFFGTWKLGALLLSMSVLYGDEGIRHRLERLRADGAGHRRRQRGPLRRGRADRVLVLDDGLLDGAPDRARSRPTPPPTTRRSSTTPRARPGWPRASSTPIATSSPTRSSSTATRCSDGERFHGMGEWAWAAGIAPLLGPVAPRRGPVRLPARGRLRPAQAARLPLPPRGHERLHDADRDALDDGDRRRRARATRSASASSAAPASRSTRRRSAGSASSTGSPCSTTTG